MRPLLLTAADIVELAAIAIVFRFNPNVTAAAEGGDCSSHVSTLSLFRPWRLLC